MIEYEAKFLNIDKDLIRDRLKEAGAKLIKPEFLQKRTVFDLPEEYKTKGVWVRVRDESDKITMSFKSVDGDKIHNQKEICLKVDNFQEAENFLTAIGCKAKSYQENKREIWNLDNVEITIDEWPFLDPFVEIEGKSEQEVKLVAEKLKFDYLKAMFGATDIVVNMKYGIPLDVINKIPRIVFDMKNPFLRHKK